MRNLSDFVVPWMNDVKSYTTDDVNMAWDHPEFRRMFLNENPYPPSQAVVGAIVDAVRNGNRYPGNGPQLRAKIAEKYQLDSDNVFLGNGSSEIIEMVMKVFVAPGDEVILPNPTFSLFESRATIIGGKVIKVDQKEDLQYDTEAILNAITSKTKVIIICTPNNPTGDFIPDEGLIRILKKGIPTLVDEAYLEYHPEHLSKAPLIRDYPNAIISHTFSKAFGLAGIRIGFCLADKEVIGYFKRIQMPWSVSLMAIAAAYSAWHDGEAFNRKITDNNREIEYFFQELNRIDSVKAYYSYGNYILIDITKTGFDPQEVVDSLLKRKVMIKTVKGYKDRKFIRISTGTEEENAFCVESLKQILQKGRENI
ncbi:MAG: histidinol-phosphate transaminase [Syntrophaceae bacterium]|nr:histidinol-phosphate transaminase [Syntrophaceae bacterium]